MVTTHPAATACARQARDGALAAGARVVSITGEGKGWPEAIEAAPPERSETYTASYLAALLVLARLAAGLGNDATRAGHPGPSGDGDPTGNGISRRPLRAAFADAGLTPLPGLVEAAAAEPSLIERPPRRLT